jgi:hypothetical protein
VSTRSPQGPSYALWLRICWPAQIVSIFGSDNHCDLPHSWIKVCNNRRKPSIQARVPQLNVAGCISLRVKVISYIAGSDATADTGISVLSRKRLCLIVPVWIEFIFILGILVWISVMNVRLNQGKPVDLINSTLYYIFPQAADIYVNHLNILQSSVLQQSDNGGWRTSTWDEFWR